MDKKVQVFLWTSWALFTPLLLWISYQLSPPLIEGFEIDLILFLLLMCLVAGWPIIINDTPVFYVQSVSLVVFLYFGLFIEILFTQVALIVLLMKVRISSKDLYRLPLNSLLFFIISLSGAIVYYAIGGLHGENHFSGGFLSALIVYELTVFFVNQLLLNTIQTILHKKSFNLLSRSFLWEFITSLIVFPIGVGMYFVYVEVGAEAILYIGIPLLALSIILTLYYKSRLINYYLQQASEIGHQLTERLEKNEVLNIFMDKLINMIPLKAAYIVDVYEKDKLKIIREYEDGKINNEPGTTKTPYKGISGHVYVMRESFLFHSRKQWKHIKDSQLPNSVESVIAVPVMRNLDLVGIVILASNKKSAFDRAQLMIIDLLSTYLGIAIENARHYEETKRLSEHCALTGLNNFLFLEKKLESEFEAMEKDQMGSLSLILLDLDHFKSVNDTYGHQAGNEVLIELADRLSKFVGRKGSVARYGGEEFVILLPNFTKKETILFAEEVRKLIANKPFTIHHTLQQSRQPSILFLTASLGVATAPEDAEDPISLIRHADRAMYLGAKQAGRNKVAGYIV